MTKNLPSDRYVIDPSNKILLKEVVVPATLEQVWHAWTTNEGAQTFFSSQTKIDFKPGGPYEIYFLLDNPYGSKGSEDCHVLNSLPMRMLSFEWNAPPEFGPLRNQRTIVVILLDAIDNRQVKVSLFHYGWGKGNDWDKLYAYFDRAWGYVLENLKRRFINGPINWSADD
jgi:uncharacterized protein YndB with AHSA1/START domain